MRVAIDVMGADLGPRPLVEGGVRAARELGIGVSLVGRTAEIAALLEGADLEGLDIDVVDAPAVIDMHEGNPAEAVRAREGNSLMVAVDLVRRERADAFVTAGHTGAAMTAATFGLGRVRGLRRPALVAPFPAITGPVALLDLGANPEVRPEFLAQFGLLGAAYAQRVLGIAEPRVGLITIGEEPSKGNATVKAAGPMLAATGLNYVGHIEGHDVPLGHVDVAVTDGFTGNVMLKFAEGIAELVNRTLREEAGRDPISLLGAVLMRPALRRVRARWSPRRLGGAMLLGVRGTVVIGHGRADADAVVSMAETARLGHEQGLVAAIADGVARAPVPGDPAD